MKNLILNISESMGVWFLQEWVTDSFFEGDYLFLKMQVPDDMLDINNELLFNYNNEYMIFEINNFSEIYDSIEATSKKEVLQKFKAS
jgi:hypothetical protein